MSKKLYKFFIVFVLITKYSEAARYTVVVKTGTGDNRPSLIDGPGTNCDVKIMIYGKSRKTGLAASTKPIKLKESSDHKNKFEEKHTDTFKNLEDNEDLIDINKIDAKISGFCGLLPNWQLDKITVITEKGDKYKFNANQWLTEKNKYYPVTNLISASTPSVVKPVTPAVQPVTPVTPAVQPVKPVTPAVQPVVTTPKVKYTVTVKTGDVKFGSTKAKVYIKIFGTSRKTGKATNTSPIHLTGASPQDQFIRTSTNVFNVEADDDLIKLSKIEVMRDGKGDHWYLEHVTIATQDGRIFEFPAKAWVNIANTYFEFKVSTPPPKPVTPAPQPPVPQPPTPVQHNKPGVIYDIIVYTGSVARKGSKAQVFMTLFGILATSSEIHLKSPALESSSQTSSSKIFQIQIEDVGKLQRIRIRQDVSAGSPNWKIEKVLVVLEYKTVYEFLVSSWLVVTKPLEKPLTDEYPATSMKFISYPQCIQPVESKVHPSPSSGVVLLNPCGKLPNFFKLHPDGVIQHLVSGMCLQGSRNGDPLKTAHGDRVLLNYPCTLYRPGYNTPRALQFKFTRGGSLMEIKSGKCVSSNKGQQNIALTFSTTCDTEDTKIGFIDKDSTVLYPQQVGKSPPKTPSTVPPFPPAGKSPTKVPQPPSTPGTPSTSSPGQVTPQPGTTPPGTPGSRWSPVYCPSSCGPASCTSTCQPLCCSQQQSATIPASYPTVVRCPSYCSPGQCRSECPVGCCFPNLVSWNDQQYDENGDSNEDNVQNR